MINKKVEEMTIADVIKHPLFYKNLKSVISNLNNARRKVIALAGVRMNRSPIDSLNERGVFEASKMIVLYAEVMDKKLQGYSSNERRFILMVGGRAFNNTMKQLIEDEKKRNISNGDNKQ